MSQAQTSKILTQTFLHYKSKQQHLKPRGYGKSIDLHCFCIVSPQKYRGYSDRMFIRGNTIDKL